MRIARLLFFVVLFLGGVTYYALNRPKEDSAPAMMTCQAYAEAAAQRQTECAPTGAASIAKHRSECERDLRPTDNCIEAVRQLSCAELGGDWRRRIDPSCAKVR